MLPIFILPIIGAALITVIGLIWYGPIFGKAYRTAMGVVMPENMSVSKKDMMVRVAVDFIMSYITLFGLLMVMNMMQANTYGSALTVAALFWFFFIMPTKASLQIWSNKSKKDNWVLFGIGSSFSLVSLVVVAPIFLWLIRFIF